MTLVGKETNMKSRFVKVFAPATIANLGPGFDVLGIAIQQPGDIVTAETTSLPGLQFSIHGTSTATPVNHENVAAHVADLMLTELKPAFGVSLVLQKLMPVGSGLGSSGASAAAAAFAINALLAKPLSRMDLIPFAMEGERLASGSAHADNVAPALLGGVCLIRSYEPLDIIKIPVKNPLFWIVAHPHVVIHTQTARDILPKQVALSTLVKQSGNLSGMILGLMMGDDSLIGRSLHDVIIEPVRAVLIPGFENVKKSALAAGALAFSISGSGPAVFAISTSALAAKKIALEIKKSFFVDASLECDIYISPMNSEGATILEKSS
jgi:homoserine kinase